MGTTTTYDVLLRYRLDNQATKGSEALTHSLRGASHQANELSNALAKAGAIAGSYIGIRGAYKHLIDFNKEVENAKISLTAMIEGGFGTSFQFAQHVADQMYTTFQRFSTQTPVTTAEMMEFGRATAMAVQRAGGGFQDMITVTEQGVIAAKAWGSETSQASLQISEFLMGNIRNTEMFVQKLAGAGGKTLEELRKMTAQQRLSFLKDVFASGALKDATKAFAESFSGVTSTLEDKLQILLGKVGLPLFKAITKEVSRWNEWIDHNSVAIDHFADTVAHKLVTAFEAVKSALGFVVDHASTLIKIGEVWAAVKIGQALGGVLSGGALALAGPIGQFMAARNFAPSFGPYRNEAERLAATTAPGTISGFRGAMGAIPGTLAAGFGGYELGAAISDTIGLKDALREAIDPNIVRLEHLERSMQKFDDSITKAHNSLQSKFGDNQLESTGEVAARLGALNEWKEKLNNLTDLTTGRAFGGGGIGGLAQGVLGDRDDVRADMVSLQKNIDEVTALQAVSTLEGKALYLQAFGELTDYQQKTLDIGKAQSDVMTLVYREVAAHRPISVADILDVLRKDSADPDGKKKPIADKPHVNITIHRIEVQSEDPDRMAFGLLKSFRDAAKNPSSALSVLREG